MMQYNILKKVLKENKIWILVLIVTLLFEFLVNKLNPEGSVKTLTEILMLPGNNITVFPAYRSILLAFLVYKLYIYEINNNYIYIFNRISIKKWFTNKILLIIAFTLSYSILYEISVYCLFYNFIEYSIVGALKNLIFNFSITFVILNIINIKIFKKFDSFIVIILILLLFKYFNSLYFIILIFILIVLNIYLAFKKKTLKNISE